MIRDAGRPGAIPNHPHKGATMPKHVRNFWIAADIDGRREPLQGGPARADGGFTMTVYQRHRGEVVPALRVSGTAEAGGKLVLRVDARDLEPEQVAFLVDDPGADVEITTER